MAASSKKDRLNKLHEEKILNRRRRNVLIVMIEIVLCLVLAIACYGVTVLNSYHYDELEPDVYKETSDSSVFREKETRIMTSVVEVTNEVGETETSVVEIPIETELSGYRNILILGVDARSMDFEMTDGINCDVIMIASINNETGDIKLVSVLRDTIMKFEDGSRKPYNKATEQFYGGVSDMVSMINRNLGLAIDEYVLVNWYGVATCINAMGGVELTIPDETMRYYVNSYLTETNNKTGLWAPQFTTAGTYTMVGTQAVAYCRVRYGGINDQGRASHQREVIEKLVEKAKLMAKGGEINTLINVAKLGLSNVRTNLKLPDILWSVTQLDSYNMAGQMQFPSEGSYTIGKYVGNIYAKYGAADVIVVNDFAQEVRNLHEFLYPDIPYEPSDFIKNISYQMTLDRTGQ